jgi:hypothetical protein
MATTTNSFGWAQTGNDCCPAGGQFFPDDYTKNLLAGLIHLDGRPSIHCSHVEKCLVYLFFPRVGPGQGTADQCNAHFLLLLITKCDLVSEMPSKTFLTMITPIQKALLPAEQRAFFNAFIQWNNKV